MAVRFHYPFQKVVDLKGSEKTQAEWVLSASIGKLQQVTSVLHQLEAEKESALDSIQEATIACCVSSLQSMQSYLSRIEQSIRNQLKDVQVAKTDVERNQLHLTDKMKDEQVWQQARERAKERYRYEMQLREQNELDEMATVRFSLSAR
ncbi:MULTISPECIES: flagellar export protein FliJ [Paenibacillus]|uniref:flagellar export protein FliJ n=1 Tax=Paenibacillus TaxID=44249 RepID=UPI00037ADD7F|nr:flagellar export protein FliJ [Paenibacillus terrigena]